MAREYKDSGIAWIGDIPKDWKMQPLAIYFAENSKPNSDLGLVNALQFKYGEIIQKPTNGKELTDKDRELLEKYTVVAPDDIVVNGLNLNYDLKSLRIAKVREDGIITSAYIVLRPRNGANASYYNYYLKALDFQKIFHGMGVGIRLTLSYNELRSMLLPVPSTNEQQRIASYLDKKCAEIDSLVELQEQMIAQLTDYKQSVITEAVTKGLNPEAELVSSGIDWIGDVPKGWKVIKLKFISKFINGFAFKSDYFNTEGEYPVIRIGDIINEKISYENIVFVSKSKELEEYEIITNDILIAMSGATVGKIGICQSNDYGYINQRVGIIRSKDYKLIWYNLLSSAFLEYIFLMSDGSAQPNISSVGIGNYCIPIPPLEEQQSIATYLDAKCHEIDTLISIKQQKIETLKEYKKSIIFEAVTGKTD